MWIQNKTDGVTIFCQIQPRASRTEIVGLHGEPERLKIRVAAPPVDGEANDELIAFLSRVFPVNILDKMYSLRQNWTYFS